MALFGNCTHTEYVFNGETQSIIIEQPDGTMKEEQQNVREEVKTDYNDVYVCVKQVEFFQTYQDQKAEGEQDSNFVKVQAVLFQIAGYESKEARDADQEAWLFWHPMQLENYDYNLNLLSQCYNQVKQTEGYTNLVNA